MRYPSHILTLASLTLCLVLIGQTAAAEDATHLCNASRTGYTRTSVRPPYRLKWEYVARHRPQPAWKEPLWEPQRIDFDYAYPVVAADGIAYFASSADHAVHALDLETGRERWKFFTGGPVRLAPTVSNGRLYFGSDGGYVYCLDAASGAVLWRFRPGIPDERLIGNGQMISRWPARSGVLVEDGRAYTTFGMLSPEGIFVCCLDAETGRVVWMNDTSGTRFMTRPHVSSMGGVSPQGYLAICEDILVVTCGRAPPALFAKSTGECTYHEAEGDFTGGARVMTHGGLAYVPAETLMKEYGAQLRRGHSGAIHAHDLASLVAMDVDTGREVFTIRGGRRGVISPDGIITLIGVGTLRRVALSEVRNAAGEESRVKHTNGHFVSGPDLATWSADTGPVHALLQAGETLIAGQSGKLTCYDAGSGKELWHGAVEGEVRHIAVTPGHVLASTTAGRIYCFTPGGGSKGPTVEPDFARAPAQDVSARRILSQVDAEEGYCLAVGNVDAGLLNGLAEGSDLTIYTPADDGEADLLRRTLDRAGLYGPRVAVHICPTDPLPYADYFADLVVCNVQSEKDLEELSATELYRVTRPYGGRLVVAFADGLERAVRRWLGRAESVREQWKEVDTGLLLTRDALPGAGEWTHQYGDPGKSSASEERRARLPLKALWFGGLGPGKIVSRHFRTPAPLVVEGRCFVPGLDHLIAMDIYNGRILWERELPDLAHWPAAYRGPSLAADRGAVYALQSTRCLRLDPATGETASVYEAPSEASESAEDGEDLIWEFLAVTDDYVIGTIGRPNVQEWWWSKAYPANHVIFALDKGSGEPVWVYRPEQEVDSNAIAISDGRVFLIEGRPRYDVLFPRRKQGEDLPPRCLLALDLETGDILWQTEEVADTQNTLWVADGVLMATMNPMSRSMEDRVVAKSGGGATGYSVRDGSRLWRLEDLGTCTPVLVDGVAYMPQALDLRTGKPIKVPDPVTGEPGGLNTWMPHTCSMYCGSPNMLMTRVGSMGFYDLQHRIGYFNYPIVCASSWINMIPAGGLVAVPEGFSSCACAYNYKTSLALVSADRSYHYGIGRRASGGAVEHLRINFGAPGDRPDADGNLWYAYPRPVAYGRPLAGAKYGPKRRTANLPIADPNEGPEPDTYEHNPDWTDIAGTDRPWVYTCGLHRPPELEVRLSPYDETERKYRLVMHFCVMEEGAPPGPFDVRIQGKTLLEDFDIRATAGGPGRALTREFTVWAGGTLTVELVPRSPGGGRGSAPLISGLEILRP